MGAIVVKDLGKAYKRYPTRWSRLIEWLSPFKKVHHTLNWVLKDISFHVQPGEAVGIIGINGAGKSTLLKMIAGTTRPTAGSINMHGRVAALLELGMGFHPDFTGRQNAIMAGQLLGYGVVEIESLMPEIEAFAEIGEYLDRPIRVYSSGMQVRLAFSVATAIRPDILIVDEALSVGDAYFQHKSFERIRKFRKQGTTLLIVSHDKQAIQSLCDSAILLNGGRLEMHAGPQEVMDYYNALLAKNEAKTVTQHSLSGGRIKTLSGTGEVQILDVSLFDEEGGGVEAIGVGKDVTLRIRAQVFSAIPNLVVGYMLKDRLGQPVYGTNTYHLGCALNDLRVGQTIEYKFSFQANLGPGSYSVSVALHEGATHLGKNYEWQDQALIFEVINLSRPGFVGLAWIPPIVECSLT